MILKIEMLRWAGTALVVVAYVPKHASCMFKNVVDAPSFNVANLDDRRRSAFDLLHNSK